MTSGLYDSRAFGDFLIEYKKENIRIRVTRDRDQIFIDFSIDGKNWEDKENIHKSLGIPGNRYKNDKFGLWDVYLIGNQGYDLRLYFKLIMDYLDFKRENVSLPELILHKLGRRSDYCQANLYVL